VNCNTTYFNTSLSSTFRNDTTDDTTKITYNNEIEIYYGYMGIDTVCLNKKNGTSCAKDFSFFVITNQTGMKAGCDGRLGLAPLKSDGT